MTTSNSPSDREGPTEAPGVIHFESSPTPNAASFEENLRLIRPAHLRVHTDSWLSVWSCGRQNHVSIRRLVKRVMSKRLPSCAYRRPICTWGLSLSCRQFKHRYAGSNLRQELDPRSV